MSYFNSFFNYYFLRKEQDLEIKRKRQLLIEQINNISKLKYELTDNDSLHFILKPLIKDRNEQIEFVMKEIP